jgi:hypothetical protein
MAQNVSGPTPSNPAQLEAHVERLQKQLDRMQGLQSSSRWIMLLLVVIVMGELAAFVYYTRANLYENFETAAVQRTISQRLPELTPRIRDRIMMVSEHVLPVYRDEAMKRFEKVGPEVASDALGRLQKLPEENGKMLQDRLKVALDGAITQIRPDMNKTFPTLADDKKMQILQEEFTGRVDKQNELLAKHITGIYDGQLKSMKDVLDKFDIPSDTNERQRVAREREFLHALVDVMMDSDMTFSGAPAAPPAPKPTTMPTASAAPVSTAVETR